MSDYRKLLVWQRAHALVLEVYRATTGFPKTERYGLTAQLRSSSASVPTNIAEGSGRGTQADFARFCRVANGSLNELEYQLLLSHDLGCLAADRHAPLATEISELRRMLTRFTQSLT